VEREREGEERSESRREGLLSPHEILTLTHALSFRLLSLSLSLSPHRRQVVNHSGEPLLFEIALRKVRKGG